jgi:hypothetical protein
MLSDTRNIESLKANILRTLLYYDIFSHPLNGDEVFAFLPKNSLAKAEVYDKLKNYSGEKENTFAEKEGYYYVKPNEHHVLIRKAKNEHARKMWKAARIVTHLIKRFPFVRAVIVTGSLSKNTTDKHSDLDFMVITAPDRLWIARNLMMIFKKIFLFNSYKFFCVNFLLTENHLEIEDKNIFTATEIATIKPTFNTGLMETFIKKNLWIKTHFPNYQTCDPVLHSPGFKVNNRKSYLQKVFELFFFGRFGDFIDEKFRKMTHEYFDRKYKNYKKDEANKLFKTERNESRTHPANMQKVILDKYNEKLKQFNLT